MAEFTRSKTTPTAEEFINAAALSVTRPQGDTVYPWEDKDPTKPKSFTLRIDEQTLAKLHWLADFTPGCRSVQSWVNTALHEAIEKGIKTLTTNNA